MQFSENQKYYLKRFAALHMPEIGRKAAYVRQELKTTWMAVDSTSVPDGVVYVYHNKEYKHIEDIVADVLDIHGDSAKIMQINNSRLACGLPTLGGAYYVLSQVRQLASGRRGLLRRVRNAACFGYAGAEAEGAGEEILDDNGSLV